MYFIPVSNRTIPDGAIVLFSIQKACKKAIKWNPDLDVQIHFHLPFWLL